MFPVLKEIRDLLHFIHGWLDPMSVLIGSSNGGDNSPLNKVISVLLLFAVVQNGILDLSFSGSMYWLLYTSVRNSIYGIYSTMNLKTRVYKQV